MSNKVLNRAVLFPLGAVALALALTGMILQGLSTSFLDTFSLIFSGAFGSWGKLAYVMTAWTPVLLCVAGLLITFASGLWNIGIEGQVVMGAIFTTGFLRVMEGTLPPGVVLTLAAAAGLSGGVLWGIFIGLLKRYGNINEIFGGLGLNFIAGSLTVYLVLGPWKRAGIGSTSGTEPFPPSLWLPPLGNFPVSIVEMLIGLIVITAVSFAIRGTHFGLRLRAIGLNVQAAFLKGIPVDRYYLAAFGICGAVAGLAGWTLIVGTSARHNLFPLISSGYGYLAILVVLLANRRAFWCVLISFFFAAISMGSLQLPLQRQLDSSLGGVIQGLLVLAILFIHGIRSRWFREGG